MPPASQSDTPYLDALRAYAARDPGRFHVPGHKGGPGADPALREAIGPAALALDIPALTYGIDVGVEPNALQEAQRLAAEAWGAKRAWFLVNGASQGNHVALLTLAHRGREVIVQRNAHSSTVDALVLSGLRPTFVAPEVDPELHIAHCMTPAALDRALSETPGAVGATVVSPTYFGAVADVAALAEVAHGHGVPLVVDEAWGAHLAFHESLPRHALSLGADLVVSSTHKIVGQPHAGRDGAPGARRPARAGGGGPLRDPRRVHEPELAAERVPRRRPAQRRGERQRAAGRDAARRSPPRARRCARSRASTSSTSSWPARRACSTTTRCGWRSTCAARAPAATRSRAWCASATT